ncbi:MAG: hypothetical protein ACRDBG_04200 [Waterburya sp.]
MMLSPELLKKLEYLANRSNWFTYETLKDNKDNIDAIYWGGHSDGENLLAREILAEIKENV